MRDAQIIEPVLVDYPTAPAEYRLFDYTRPTSERIWRPTKPYAGKAQTIFVRFPGFCKISKVDIEEMRSSVYRSSKDFQVTVMLAGASHEHDIVALRGEHMLVSETSYLDDVDGVFSGAYIEMEGSGVYYVRGLDFWGKLVTPHSPGDIADMRAAIEKRGAHVWAKG